MAFDATKNFAKATVSTGYDASATSIVLATGHGANLPQPSTDGEFNLVWWNNSDYGDPSDDPNKEIVRCTARSTDTLTVTRAQESTSASIKNIAGRTYRMALTFTSKVMDDIIDGINNAGVEGVSTFTASTVAYLTGGTSHSALSVFRSLGSGTNDGKVKINVDGTEYDNVAIELHPYTTDAKILEDTDTPIAYAPMTVTNYVRGMGQTFTATSGISRITSVKIRTYQQGTPAGGQVLTLTISATSPTGTTLGSTTVAAGTAGWKTFTFSTPIEVTDGNVYAFTVFSNGGTDTDYWSIGRITAGTFSGGNLWEYNSGGGGWYNYGGTNDSTEFEIWGQVRRDLTDMDEIAANLQTAIRAATSGTETAVYSTDHFVITGTSVGTTSSIARFTSPTSGTDISGAGATAYLDCAANATPTQGTGNNGKASLLNSDGRVTPELLQSSTISGTQVFSGSTPTDWTNLDISAVVGDKASVAILKIVNESGSSEIYAAFRRNGDTISAYDVSEMQYNLGGSNVVSMQESKAVQAITATDSSGILQWKCSGAVTATVYVEAYW